MPIYLCQPGTASREPWRHGVQAYERPFPLVDPPAPSKPAALSAEGVREGPRQIVILANPAQKYAALKCRLSEMAAAPSSHLGNKAVVFCSGRDRGEYACEGWARGLKRDGFAATAMCGGNAAARGDAEWAAVVEGFMGSAGGRVLVVDRGCESIVREGLGLHKVRLVVNFDLFELPIRTYVRRLSYASETVVSFFHAGEDAHMARDLVNTLQQYGQEVPEELERLVPPALMTPPQNRSRSRVEGDEGAGDEGIAERGRPARGAIPLREDSRSPGPDDIHNRADDAPNEGDAERRRRLQREFRQNRDATTSHSSLEEDSLHVSAGGRAPSVPAGGGTFQFVPGAGGSGPSAAPNPVRRVRHAEVVLVDRALIAHGRTWLRLRWPGEHGGFGGYVALSKIDENVKAGYYKVAEEEDGEGKREEGSSDDTDDGSAQEEEDIGASPPPPTTTVAAASSVPTALVCQETRVYYPTSAAMKLLPLYDDGLASGEEGGEEGAMLLENGEPVFCRICREGLHDVNYDLEKATDDASSSRGARAEGSAAATGNESEGTASAAANSDALGSDSSLSTAAQPTQQRDEGDAPAAAAHHPPLVLHHPTAENPLLAPCDCTGSMAFVHYLCVEQWRCRSRHPGARGGLNCETCGAEYTLPPPPSRPAGRHDGMGGAGMGNVMAEDDWLDAMPPHVLAALRRPHPAWQLGAAVVRRRWLRPVVPVLVSPLVALYCRARRTLKKRGVSRRRWACSLCRRRARWKCVRCLRSYYCSRQCQNVSWHIVHKHVCYKPVRFWWSVVVYTLGICLAVPGIVENFPLYDAMVTLVPVNFIALGIIGGGAASTLKRFFGMDIRGRMLEVIVVTLTLLLTSVSSGLVRGFFGDVSRCWGVFVPSLLSDGREAEMTVAAAPVGPFDPPILNTVLVDIPLRQVQLWYLKWDFILSKLGFVSRRFICTPTADGNTDYSVVGCSPSARNIDPQFYLSEENEGRCSADMALVMGVWFSALGVLLLGNLYRQLRGARRNGVAGGRGRRRHEHQD